MYPKYFSQILIYIYMNAASSCSRFVRCTSMMLISPEFPVPLHQPLWHDLSFSLWWTILLEIAISVGMVGKNTQLRHLNNAWLILKCVKRISPRALLHQQQLEALAQGRTDPAFVLFTPHSDLTIWMLKLIGPANIFYVFA